MRTSSALPLVLAAVALTLLSGCSGTFGCSAGGASASCAAPEVTSVPTDVAPGSELRFTAGPFSTACDDTGCGVAQPADDVPVVFVVGDRQLELGSLDADEGLEVHGRYTLPSDLPVGLGTLTVGDPDDLTATADVTVSAAH